MWKISSPVTSDSVTASALIQCHSRTGQGWRTIISTVVLFFVTDLAPNCVSARWLCELMADCEHGRLQAEVTCSGVILKITLTSPGFRNGYLPGITVLLIVVSFG